MRRKIRLARGEEILVNGFVIRGVGFNEKNPEQLSIYHPNMGAITEEARDPMKAVYAGSGGQVTCASSLVVGLVGDLATSVHGWPEAIATAKQWLRDHIPFFLSRPEILDRAVAASK